MTFFINRVDFVLYDDESQQLGVIKKNTRLIANRVSPYFIQSPTFGLINTHSQDIVIWKELDSIHDFEWNAITTMTNEILVDFIKILIPDHNEIEIMHRYRKEGGYSYKIRYNNMEGRMDSSAFALLQPLQPLLLRIKCRDGVRVRTEPELHCEDIGYLPFGAHVVVDKKQFASLPVDDNCKMWRIYNKNLWFTESLVDQESAVELIGYAGEQDQMDTIIVHYEIQETKKCLICFDQKADQTFVHGKTGHTLCCHKCSVQVLETTGRCPTCRLPIEKIISNF